MSFVISGAAAGQSPPPTGPVATVGIVNQMQTGGPIGDQRIGAICAPAFFRGTAPVGAGGVALGGSICWWSEAIHPGLVPLTQQLTGTCFTFFLVSPFVFTTIQLPFAAPGHDMVFLPPQATLTLSAPWTQTLTTGGGGAVVPPGGFDRWFLTLDVPGVPALIGSVWAAQAARIDPTNQLIYFSDEYLVQVWN